MGIFDFFKSKVKDVVKSVEEASSNENPKNEDYVEPITADVEDDDDDDDDDDEVEYIPSTKLMQGVPYPHGWEDLSEMDIYKRMEVIMDEYNEADGDDDLEDAIFPKHGFEDASHYEEFKTATMQERAEKDGVSITQAAMSQNSDRIADVVQTAIDAGQENIQPFEGVSLRDWAKANASFASTGSVDEALKITNKDKAGWDKVNEEWTTRMTNDTTYVISQIYAEAFNASATGNLGGADDINAENFPYERYIEVGVAQDLLCQQGKDAQEVLAMFDLTAVDWSNAASFWHKEFTNNVDKYLPLDNEYRKKYEEKYKAGESNADIEF